jgi:hypothetical protein
MFFPTFVQPMGSSLFGISWYKFANGKATVITFPNKRATLLAEQIVPKNGAIYEDSAFKDEMCTSCS